MLIPFARSHIGHLYQFVRHLLSQDSVVANTLFSQVFVLAALVYILWPREIDRNAHVGGNPEEEADNSKHKKKSRIRSEKEDWNIVRGGLATWRGRRRESPSEV